MALRQLTFLGNPVLRARAGEATDLSNPKLLSLAGDMAETMLANNGVGLAAPQIGVGTRLIVFRIPPERAEQEGGGEVLPIHILINPEITPLDAAMEAGLEGCLSLPGLRGMVPRYTHIGYRGYDVAGRLIEREAHGFHARVVQHEVDHLDGIMYLDRMADFTTLQHESEIIRRIRREAKEWDDEETTEKPDET